MEITRELIIDQQVEWARQNILYHGGRDANAVYIQATYTPTGLSRDEFEARVTAPGDIVRKEYSLVAV